MKQDLVNSPDHYAGQGSIECKELIKVVVSCYEAWEAACVANIVKYVWRCHNKDGARSLKSSIWYLKEAMQSFAQRSEEDRFRLKEAADSAYVINATGDTPECLLLNMVYQQMHKNVYNDQEFLWFKVIINGLRDGGIYRSKSNALDVLAALESWSSAFAAYPLV